VTLALPVDTPPMRKARGASFTPEPVARHIISWAVRSPEDSVLEPSCGEAAFLLAADARQRSLGRQAQQTSGDLHGVEMHTGSAAAARQILRAAGASAHITTADFFTVSPTPRYDAVVGNPPFVRYQDFSGEARARSRASALRAGVSLTNLASSWAAFTVHAALFLRPGGRLGLVLPAELLSVNYAAGVRQFLMERFGRIRLVLFTERVFPGVLEEVVLLLAEGEGPTEQCELLQVHNADDLIDLQSGRRSTWTPSRTSAKWSGGLVPGGAAAICADLISSAAFSTMHAWGETTLGMVTGANKYFALSPARVRELRLPETDLVALSPPGSRHLRGLSFTAQLRARLGDAGASTWMFRPSAEPGLPSWEYIRRGADLGIDQAYKCRVRTPWWRVPLQAPADLFLTYMNADTARLTTNVASVHHLNSVHGVYLHGPTVELGRLLLPLASLNSVTLLSAETVGRAYGGGMLKVEPREADALPMPSPRTVVAARYALLAVRERVTARLKEGRLMDAVRIVDHALLLTTLGMARSDVSELEEAHAMLTARRKARALNARDRV